MMPARRFSFVVALLPPVVTAVLVAAWGVDLPYWDQWEMVPRLDALADGRLDLGGLWRQHNEHRLFFPRLLMLALAWLGDWNLRWELAANLLLAAALAAVLVALLRRTADVPVPPAVLVLGSLVVFSPSQWMNWSWGWQIQIFLVVLATAATALCLADAERPGRLVAGAASAAVATGSFANGLLVWPLALPLVLAPRRGRWRRATTWTVLGAAAWGLYFHDFGLALDGGLDRGPWWSVKHFGAYVVLYLGAPLFGYHGRLCLWAGFVAVAVALVLAARWTRDAVRRGHWRRAAPWTMLVAWALASAAMTAAGRLHLGIGQALSSRYVTLSDLFWLGLLGLWPAPRPPAPRRDARRPSPRQLAGALLAATLLVHAVAGAWRWHDSYRQRAELRRALRATATPAQVEALDLAPLFPDPAAVRSHVETLRRHRLSLFRDEARAE